MNGSRAYSGFYKFLEYCFARCALCFLRIVPVKLFKSFNRKYESVFGRRKSIYEPGGFYNTSSIDQI